MFAAFVQVVFFTLKNCFFSPKLPYIATLYCIQLFPAPNAMHYIRSVTTAKSGGKSPNLAVSV